MYRKASNFWSPEVAELCFLNPNYKKINLSELIERLQPQRLIAQDCCMMKGKSVWHSKTVPLCLIS